MAKTSGSGSGSEPELGPTPNLDSLTFEDAFALLSEMASSLEEGGLTLTGATARYEQGMSLVRHCNQLLEQAELKRTELKDSYNQASASSEEEVPAQSEQMGLEQEFGLGSDLTDSPEE